MMKMIPSYKIDLAEYKSEIYERFDRVIDSGQLVLGEETEKAEQLIAGMHNKAHGIAVNSDTAALECCLQTVKKKTGILLMPEMAFFGVLNVAIRMGFKVVLVDCHAENGIMPTKSEWMEAYSLCVTSLGGPPDAAMIVYTGGMASPDVVDTIRDFRSLGVTTIEDCAHCHGATYADDRFVGSEGDFATWSMYATKLLHSGEGGMIATNDPRSAEVIKMYRSYGRKAHDGVFQESVGTLGYNWRMTEFQAAILNVMWIHLPDLIEARKKVASIYDEYFPSASSPPNSIDSYCLIPASGTKNFYRYTVLVEGIGRKFNIDLYASLKRKGIILQEKTNHLPLSWMSAYADRPDVFAMAPSIGSGKFAMEHFSLPIYPQLSEIDARYIAESFLYCIQELPK